MDSGEAALQDNSSQKQPRLALCLQRPCKILAFSFPLMVTLTDVWERIKAKWL